MQIKKYQLGVFIPLHSRTFYFYLKRECDYPQMIKVLFVHSGAMRYISLMFHNNP